MLWFLVKVKMSWSVYFESRFAFLTMTMKRWYISTELMKDCVQTRGSCDYFLFWIFPEIFVWLLLINTTKPVECLNLITSLFCVFFKFNRFFQNGYLFKWHRSQHIFLLIWHYTNGKTHHFWIISDSCGRVTGTGKKG